MQVRVVCVWFVLVATVVVARAQKSALEWQAPAGCPAAVDVRQRIERRLGMAIERAIRGIAVRIHEDRDGYVADVDLRGLTVENDIRVLRGAQCDELTDAIAIVLARVASELAAAPRPPQLSATDDPLPDPPRGGRGSWNVGARVLGLSGIGAMPRVGLGGELAMFVSHGTTYAEVVGSHWFPSAAKLNHEAPARVDIDLTLAALRLGWAPAGMPVRAWVGVEAGTISGVGVALGINEMGSALWVAGSTGVGVAWRISPWLRLVGSLEVAVPFSRPRFVLLDSVEVFRPEPAAARSGLGLEVSM